MLKIAVPSNDGENISEDILKCLLFLIYETSGSEVHSISKRAQIHGVMSTIDDCDVLIGNNCPEAIIELLEERGIQTYEENRKDANRAVSGLLSRFMEREQFMESSPA